MYNGLDIFATLHRIVRRALECLPEARRGSLIVRDGPRLICRAVVADRSVVAGGRHLASDAGKVSSSPPFGPEAAPEAANGMCVVPAASWYRVHHSGVDAFSEPQAAEVAGGVFVLVVPFHLHGSPFGYLALEQASAALPEGERRVLLELLAESAGSVLERRDLHYKSARMAQEMCLLEEVLSAVAASVDLGKLVDTVGSGIRSVQPGPQWLSVGLALFDDGGRKPGEVSPGALLPGWFYRAPNHPMAAFWSRVHEGVTVAGRDLQISVDFMVGDAEGPMSQSAILEAGIRLGVHGIAIAPRDPVLIEPLIQRASDAGIPVVTIDSPPVAGSRALLYIGTDNVAAGRLAGDMMRRLVSDGGIIATQVASIRATNNLQRIKGFTSALADSGLSVGEPAETHYDAALGLKLAIAALEEQPGIGGALGICSENGPCWSLAARALGRSGDLKIIAFDLVTATSVMLREGEIHAAVVQHEFEIGYRSVQILYDMISRGVDEVLAELPASRIVDTGVDIVTLERTPWSTALSDYLNQSAVRNHASRRLSRGSTRPLKLLVVGMAEHDERTAEESTGFKQDSLVGRVTASNRSLVVDPLAAEFDGRDDMLAARRDGVRTLVGVPLSSREGVLGVLVLGSARVEACSAEDLTLLERIGATAAIAIENAQLLRRTIERSRDLERANDEQQALLRMITEMSSPVVPIARGVLVMPLVGTLDTQRSSRFMEALLQEISDHRARVVLIDVTGMAVVDVTAANHLVEAARAAGLLGAEVVLVGISPAAAQLIVEQDLDLGDVVTRSTLELGFAYALQKTKGRIVYAR